MLGKKKKLAGAASEAAREARGRLVHLVCGAGQSRSDGYELLGTLRVSKEKLVTTLGSVEVGLSGFWLRLKPSNAVFDLDSLAETLDPTLSATTDVVVKTSSEREAESKSNLAAKAKLGPEGPSVELGATDSEKNRDKSSLAEEGVQRRNLVTGQLRNDEVALLVEIPNTGIESALRGKVYDERICSVRLVDKTKPHGVHATLDVMPRHLIVGSGTGVFAPSSRNKSAVIALLVRKLVDLDPWTLGEVIAVSPKKANE